MKHYSNITDCKEIVKISRGIIVSEEGESDGALGVQGDRLENDPRRRKSDERNANLPDDGDDEVGLLVVNQGQGGSESRSIAAAIF